MDFKDYSIAVCKSPDLNNPPWFQELTYFCHYGTVMRGRYDLNACDLLQKEDNYKDNVRTFGLEYVLAETQGKSAVMPVESEADILFVFCHDLGAQSEPALVPFKYNDDDPTVYPPSPWGDTQLFEWAIRPQDFTGQFDVGRDADWLAAIACSEIGNYWVDGAGRVHDTRIRNPLWRQIIGPGHLKSVLGFRRDVGYIWQGNPGSNWDLGYWYFRYFLGTFSDSLSDDNWQSDQNKWANPLDRPLNPLDKGVLCWMEAAQGQYGWLCQLQHDHPEWKEIHPEILLGAAAIDSSEYYLDDPDGDGVYKIYKIGW